MMQGSLFLTPQNVQHISELDTLQAVLANLAMLGELIVASPAYRAYRVGDNFTRHVVYAGCSPHLRFAPENPDDLDFCHIALHGPFDQAIIQTGANTGKPRCPECRGRLADWPGRLEAGHALPCTHCGTTLAGYELDWRQQAAVGRVLLEIRNVFPGEASPSDLLLSKLQAATGFTWGYAWAAALLSAFCAAEKPL